MNNKTKINKNTFLYKQKHNIFLLLIVVLSFFLNFYAISKYGYGNEYYAAAIKSMTKSFHNFFFVSFDPSGMVSVDKPPLGLWIQAIFVLIFGYHGWAMLLPQALAGSASCFMIYVLTNKYFGKKAGLLSAFLFSITPVVVVASRNNTIDMQLIFVLLIAVRFLFKSIETKKWRYLFISAIFIGIGFNIKMLQAYLVLPAFAVIYLIFAKEAFFKRMIAGLISILIVFAVSFSWVLAVDLYPKDSRPYVDSSTNNTVLELIIGHNGMERIYGQQNGGAGKGKIGQNFKPGQQGNSDGFNKYGNPPDNEGNFNMAPPQGFQDGYNTENNNMMPPQAPQGNNADNNMTPPQQGPQDGNNSNMTPPQDFQNGNDSNRLERPGGRTDGMYGNRQPFNNNGYGMGGSHDGGKMSNINNNPGGAGRQNDEIGTASLFRLWNDSLYGQGSWFIILVFFSILVFIKKIDIKNLTQKQCVYTLWILWFATMFIFFSFAGFYHRYYLSMMAPAVSILAGTGIIKMLEAFRTKQKYKQYLLPAALITVLAIQSNYVIRYQEIRSWLVPVMTVTGIISLVFMALNYFRNKRIFLNLAAIFMIISISAAPFYWSLTPLMYVPNSTLPYAGPELKSQNGDGKINLSKTNDLNIDSGMTEYLIKNYKKGSFLIVTQRATDAAKYIINTNYPVYAYGGFLGSDNSLTLDKLKQYVSEGKITYFLVSGENMAGNSEIISYVKENATLIDPKEYGASTGQGGGMSGSFYLFK